MAENKEQFKNYRVGEIIGRGRFAIVYRAEKLDVRKTVALKVLNPEYARRADIRDQFREQAKQQAKLTHPRLVRVEDLREEHGQFFVAMEYMPLGSLRSWITQNGMLSFRQAAIILEDAAEALDYLHGRKLVHGDVKPGNILLIDDPNQKNVLRAKLSDLRLPLVTEVSQTVSDSLIELTPEYISPEQASGTQTTPLSDQYSLGVVAYEMLCGQAPFTNKSQVDLYIDHQRTRPPSLQQLNDQVTGELEQVVLRALEKAPENRFASCGEFARTFRAAVAATEQKRLTALLDSAERLLDKQEFDQARVALKDALLIQPENEKAMQLLTRLDQQESLSKNYKQAVDALQLAEAKAQAIRKTSTNDPDEAELLKTFAPPPPPIWKQLTEHWKSAGQFAAVLLILILICLVSITAWIDVGADESIQPTIVAFNRTSTPTFTPTSTPTFTPTSTPTFTPTSTPTNTPTPTHIGGGTGKIIFVSQRDGNSEIYMMNVDGSKQVNLTNNSKDDFAPVWSPNGQKLAFISDSYPNRNIYAMNASGTDLNKLTNVAVNYYKLIWSPDNNKVIFVAQDTSYPYNSQIYMANAASDGQINISNSKNAYDPVWSPDSKKIAFVTTRDGHDQIYLMNADGSEQTNLSNNNTNNYNPVWSPDGKKIAFYSHRDGNWGIYVMNVDGTGQVNLTNHDGDNYDPAWSPDGKKIAFYSHRDGNDEIYVMNVDGTGQVNLTNHDGDDYYPVWSPDGKKIAFYSHRDGNWQVYMMNADGSGQVNLSNDSSDNYNFPVWSPDGKKIAFPSHRDGNWEIYVANADGRGQVNVSNNSKADYAPVWSP
jgi:Tol biopolymer transport system component